jgi:shikimate dehydrogenase
MLVVNTTPVGMWPKVDESPWPEDLPLPAAAAVYDLVYRPRQTALVTRARAAGLHATAGVGMLVEQAALAFELWTERIADRKAMLAAAMAD